MSGPITQAQVDAALAVMKAVADAIRDLGEVPSGELYARVMQHMDLRTYDRIIDRLIGAGLVQRTGSHLLRWVGPKE